MEGLCRLQRNDAGPWACQSESQRRREGQTQRSKVLRGARKLVATSLVEEARVVAHQKRCRVKGVAQRAALDDRAARFVQGGAGAHPVNQLHEAKRVDHRVGHPLRRL